MISDVLIIGFGVVGFIVVFNFVDCFIVIVLVKGVLNEGLIVWV